MAYKPGGLGLVTGIHGHNLQVNVAGCRNLSDKEWFSRQDPYVTIEYGNNRFRTRTDTDGGKNPTFNEKFTIPLIEGLREMNVSVWNSNTVSLDDFIGSARVLLEKVLSTSYDDSSWALKSKHGKTAGEVSLILHYANGNATRIGNENKLQGDYPAAGYPPAYGAPAGYPPSVYPSSGYSTAAAHGAPAGYSPSGYPSSGYPTAAAQGAPSGYPRPAHGAPSGYPPPVHGAPPSYAAGPAPGYPPSLAGYSPAGGYPPSASAYSSSQSSYGPSYPAPGYPPAPGHAPSGHAQYPAPAGGPSPVYGVPPGGYPGYNPSF